MEVGFLKRHDAELRPTQRPHLTHSFFFFCMVGF
jgi:hypothetical protein